MKRLLIIVTLFIYLPTLSAYGIPELTYTNIQGVPTQLTQASLSAHFTIPEQDTPQNCKLILGIRAKHNATIQAALAAGADPHIVLQNGWTPLHLAAHAGFVAGFTALYFNNPFQRANIHIPGIGKQNPLDLILKSLLTEHQTLTELQTGADFFAHRRACLMPFMNFLKEHYSHSRELTKIYDTMRIVGWLEETSV